MRRIFKAASGLGWLALMGLSVPAMAQHSAVADTEPAAETAPAPDPCAEESACRYITEYRLEGPEGQALVLPAGVNIPWVANGNLLLTPGEAAVVRLVEADGVLEPELVRAGDPARANELAAGEIRFEFSDYSRGNVELTIVSAYSSPLEYAAIAVSANAGPERTSVCTLLPGVMVVEHWQSQPIFQLALWSFRPTEDYSCRVIDPEAEIGQDSGA